MLAHPTRSFGSSSEHEEKDGRCPKFFSQFSRWSYVDHRWFNVDLQSTFRSSMQKLLSNATFDYVDQRWSTFLQTDFYKNNIASIFINIKRPSISFSLYWLRKTGLESILLNMPWKFGLFPLIIAMINPLIIDDHRKFFSEENNSSIFRLSSLING